MKYYKQRKEFFNRLEAYILNDEKEKSYNTLTYWAQKEYGYSYITVAKCLRILEGIKLISWNRESNIILPLAKKTQKKEEKRE